MLQAWDGDGNGRRHGKELWSPGSAFHPSLVDWSWRHAIHHLHNSLRPSFPSTLPNEDQIHNENKFLILIIPFALNLRRGSEGSAMARPNPNVKLSPRKEAQQDGKAVAEDELEAGKVGIE